MRKQSINKIRLQTRAQILSKDQLIKLKGGDANTSERDAETPVEIIIVDDINA